MNQDTEPPVISIKNLDVEIDLEFFYDDTFKDFLLKLFNKRKRLQACGNKRVRLFHDISLDVFKGERLGILGMNGAGKTTLCRFIAGMMHPQRGQVLTSEVTKAFFGTSTGLLTELTGEENAKILAFLFFPELSNEERATLVEDALEFSELGDFKYVQLKKYSKGMSTRLFLSVISGAPSDVLILDEVFNGADFFFNKKISERFAKTIKESGAVVFVSHSFEALVELCTRVVVLHQGKIVFDGDVIKGIHFYRALSSNTEGGLK